MPSSTAPPQSDIPILPGHYRRTMGYFVRCWLSMAAGIVVFGLGLRWDSVVIQIIGGVAAFVAFLWMFRTLAHAGTAPCPTCSTMMSQSWDTKHRQTDGIFVCPQCQGRWRILAIWGFE